jgi:hypothetical protein
MNAHFLQSKLGSPVHFGDIIQLFHVKSGKYLTIAKAELAETEKENVRIFLSPDGSSDSWLQVLPRFKVDREGDRVAGNTEAFFRFSDRGNIYLHCAERGKSDGSLREVNGAMDSPTPWRINIFQRHEDTLNKDFLLGGQLVSFLDPEVKAYLTVLSRPESIEIVTNDENNLRADIAMKKSRERRRRKDKLSRDPSHDSRGSSQKEGGSIEDSISLDGGSIAGSFDGGSMASSVSVASITSVEEFINTYGELVLTKMDRVQSEVLWVIEKNPVNRGGHVKCKSDTVRLRHLNSGKCLVLENAGGLESEMLKLVAAPQPDVGFFSIMELNTKVLILHSAHPVNICHGEFFLERGEYVDDYRSYYVKMTKKKARATSLIVTRFEEPPSNVKYTVAQPLETTVGLAVGRFFSDALSKILLPNFDARAVQKTTIWTDPNATVAKTFQDTVSKIIRYVTGFPICEGVIPITVSLGIDAVVSRQTLLKEQGAIKNVIRVLATLAPISAYSTSENSKDRADSQDIYMQGNDVIYNCIKLIAECVKSNSSNQLYVADYLMVIIAHSGSIPLAGILVRSLLEENLELQETKLSLKEIEYFSTKIQESCIFEDCTC